MECVGPDTFEVQCTQDSDNMRRTYFTLPSDMGPHLNRVAATPEALLTESPG